MASPEQTNHFVEILQQLDDARQRLYAEADDTEKRASHSSAAKRDFEITQDALSRITMLEGPNVFSKTAAAIWANARRDNNARYILGTLDDGLKLADKVGARYPDGARILVELREDGIGLYPYQGYIDFDMKPFGSVPRLDLLLHDGIDVTNTKISENLFPNTKISSSEFKHHTIISGYGRQGDAWKGLKDAAERQDSPLRFLGGEECSKELTVQDVPRDSQRYAARLAVLYDERFSGIEIPKPNRSFSEDAARAFGKAFAERIVADPTLTTQNRLAIMSIKEMRHVFAAAGMTIQDTFEALDVEIGKVLTRDAESSSADSTIRDDDVFARKQVFVNSFLGKWLTIDDNA